MEVWKSGRLAGWLNVNQSASLPILQLLLVWLLTFPAVTPFLQPALPRSADGLLHLYRVVALDAALQQGALFPRWLPDLAFGYGFPLFVFYAPLVYYLAELWHLLGLSVVSALNLSFILALFVAASGVFLFVKDLRGVKAGLLAAVAYVYAPYHLFDALARGSLPSVWAAALFPWTFWAFERLLRYGSRREVALSALLFGLALLTHNIAVLLFVPLLLFYLAIRLPVLSVVEERPAPARVIGVGRALPLKVGLALALGLGLAAFFWLPAVIEKNFVQVERVITPPDFDYHEHFVSLGALFSLPAPANTGLLNPDFSLTLGLAQVGLAAVGLMALLGVKMRPALRLRTTLHPKSQPEAGRRNPKSPRSLAPRFPIALYALLSLAVAIFMTLPLSVGVWDRLPLIAFVQHPHRLLGPIALLLAILVGLAVVSLPARWQLGFTLGGILLIFLSAVPLLYPRYYDPLPAPPTVAGMYAYERAIGAIGTTSFGEYLPVWVRQTPRESPLEPLYQNQAAVERLDPAYLPATATIESASYGLNRAELQINTPEPGQAVFHIFYFPGWTARLDGQPLPLGPVTERGLIGLDLPAGSHRLELFFRETPVRLAANLLSFLSGLILIALIFAPKRVPPPLPRSTVYCRLPTAQLILLTALALGLILSKTLYFDRFDTPLKQSFTGHLIAVDQPLQVNFGHQLQLLGYDLDRVTVPSGEAFALTAYWQAHQPLNLDYSSLAQLVDDRQHWYAGQDNLHPGNLPTSRWEPWGFVRDPHRVEVPPGTPPGDYFLVTGPYDPASWTRLPVLEGVQPGWPDVFAIPVTVSPAAQPPSVAELGIAWPVEVELGAVRLLGVSPERESITANDFLRLALFWEAVTKPEVDYQVQLRLVDQSGEVRLEQVSPPSHGRYSTTVWALGERVRDNQALWVPTDFPPGRYRLELRLLDEAQQPLSEWVALGELD